MYFKASAPQICDNRSAGQWQSNSKVCQNKNAHTEGPDVRVIESSSIVAAGFGTLKKQVAGFHRAVPSTTLDKACMQF